MGIHQLDTNVLVTTPLGEGSMAFVYDGGDETYWGVWQRETAELWWWRGHQVRYAIHISEGFVKQSPIGLSEGLRDVLKPHLERNGQSK